MESVGKAAALSRLVASNANRKIVETKTEMEALRDEIRSLTDTLQEKMARAILPIAQANTELSAQLPKRLAEIDRRVDAITKATGRLDEMMSSVSRMESRIAASEARMAKAAEAASTHISKAEDRMFWWMVALWIAVIVSPLLTVWAWPVIARIV